MNQKCFKESYEKNKDDLLPTLNQIFNQLLILPALWSFSNQLKRQKIVEKTEEFDDYLEFFTC